MPEVAFELSSRAMVRYEQRLGQLLEAPAMRRVCEVGGGTNPVLHLDQIERRGLEYLLTDISAAELAQAPPGYRTAALDITDRRARDQIGEFDLVLTRWVGEHVEDPGEFHAAVFELLRPGGVALHLFSTLWSAPAIANLLLPEVISRPLLRRFAPRAEEKFPARYGWCRGPSARARARFESVGFVCHEYRGFFGHQYFDGLGVLGTASRRLAQHRLWRPRSRATMFAMVQLQRPAPE